MGPSAILIPSKITSSSHRCMARQIAPSLSRLNIFAVSKVAQRRLHTATLSISSIGIGCVTAFSNTHHQKRRHESSTTSWPYSRIVTRTYSPKCWQPFLHKTKASCIFSATPTMLARTSSSNSGNSRPQTYITSWAH